MSEKKQESVQINIETLSAMVHRMRMATNLGMQYEGERNLYQALGYPLHVNYHDYLGKYIRLDIAKAIIDRPVGATWRGVLALEESKKGEDTPFELAWQTLRDSLNLKMMFSRVDRLASIGRYAVLLLGFSDTPTLENFNLPVSKNVKLVYVRPFSEDSAKIKEYSTVPTDPRFGLPVTYTVCIHDLLSGTSATIDVHYSRILHVVVDSLESEIEGIPALESVYNRLLDLEKIVGGDGEMFWRGARPGYTGKVDKEYSSGPETEASLKDQVNEFEHNLRRILINEGVELKALDQQIADPTPHVDIQIQMIAAVKGIPKRILTGSERGELSSAQDSDEWRAYIQERREEHAEVHIVHPFVKKMIEHGILPKPATNTYVVKWPNIHDLNPKEKSEVGKNRAAAIKEYTTNTMAQVMLPPEAALEFLVGLDSDQIEQVMQMIKKGMGEEEDAMRESMEFIKEIAEPPVSKENNDSQSEDSSSTKDSTDSSSTKKSSNK